MTYSEIISKLEKRGMMPDGPPQLKLMKAGLDRLLPELQIDPLKTVVVAGTNGKGSVCASLEALLRSAGKSVGLYTSPHLISTTERIRINGEDISQELFCKVYSEVIQRVEGLNLSHFEILTLMAAWLFYSGREVPRVDIAIFEVGLGGTWDATNVIPHHHCVITSLGFDHENLLGGTLAEIALNKFGIVGPGSSVVHSPLPAEVASLAKETQRSTSSTWTESIPFSYQVDQSYRTPQFLFECGFGKTTLSLPGLRAAQNTATALTIFCKMGFSPENHLQALKTVRWPGRMELYRSSPCPIYLSGDHNPQGIGSLLELLPYYSRKHLHVLVGVGQDKNLDGILGPLMSLPNTSVYLTETPFRGRPLQTYGHWLNSAAGAWAHPQEALQYIISQAGPEDLILVTGSLYLVGLVKTLAW